MEPEIYRDMAKIQDQHWWSAARREILSVVISRLPLPSQSATNILEIGCRTGGNLGMLSRFGKISAVEMDDFARRPAELVGETLVKPRALPAPLPFPIRAFDLVCVFDVLERVEDDASGLAAAGQMAHRSGRILITVPAYNWLFGAHDRAHHHFRRYTANDLGQHTRSGLENRTHRVFQYPLIPRYRSEPAHGAIPDTHFRQRCRASVSHPQFPVEKHLRYGSQDRCPHLLSIRDVGDSDTFAAVRRDG